MRLARIRGDGTEFADYEPVAYEIEMVKDACLLEALRTERIVVIGEIADLDGRPRHQWLQEAAALLVGHRVDGVRIGKRHGRHLWR